MRIIFHSIVRCLLFVVRWHDICWGWLPYTHQAHTIRPLSIRKNHHIDSATPHNGGSLFLSLSVFNASLCVPQYWCGIVAKLPLEKHQMRSNPNMSILKPHFVWIAVELEHNYNWNCWYGLASFERNCFPLSTCGTLSSLAARGANEYKL